MLKPDFAGRVKKLRALMEKSGLDACLVNSRNGIFYYTGAEAGDSSFLLVPKNSKPVIFTTSLNNNIRPSERFGAFFIKDASEISKQAKIFARIGFDEYATSYFAFLKLKKSGLNLTPAASAINEPRMVKDQWEISQIRKAGALTAKTMLSLGNFSGKKEAEISDRLYLTFRKAGANPSFDPIVASGKNSAFVHHIPQSKKISQKGLVIVDMGARVRDYCSDMTRTFCKGPGQKEKRIMEDIKEMQAELMGMAREGTSYEEIEKKYEALLGRKGYKLMHSFGHGVGIGVHERPSKGDVLKAGMVITVEPGAYIRNFGGCRIEDTFLIRKGKPEVLTKFR